MAAPRRAWVENPEGLTQAFDFGPEKETEYLRPEMNRPSASPD
jgi:hypothetical protein